MYALLMLWKIAWKWHDIITPVHRYHFSVNFQTRVGCLMQRKGVWNKTKIQLNNYSIYQGFKSFFNHILIHIDIRQWISSISLYQTIGLIEIVTRQLEGTHATLINPIGLWDDNDQNGDYYCEACSLPFAIKIKFICLYHIIVPMLW